LIGDAAANSKDDVKKNRQGFNWKGSKFENPTFY
jgi:hypothetical protein